MWTDAAELKRIYDILVDAFLNNKPLKTRGGNKAFIKTFDKTEDIFVFKGYVSVGRDDNRHSQWTAKGTYWAEGTDEYDIIGLWEEEQS